MILNKKLEKDIKEYCNLNNLKINDFVNFLLKKAFLEEKYGKSPFKSEKVSIFASGNGNNEDIKENNLELNKEEKVIPNENKSESDTVKTEEIYKLKVKPNKRKLS